MAQTQSGLSQTAQVIRELRREVGEHQELKAAINVALRALIAEMREQGGRDYYGVLWADRLAALLPKE